MKRLRIFGLLILAAAFVLMAGADILAPYGYAAQFREHANEAPSRAFPLGTDELGRDRFSRLLYGSRISLLFASAAAAFSTFLAGLIGLTAGYWSGWRDELATVIIDLFLSLPWLFALLIVRALLPLNAAPWLSITATTLLLSLIGWAPGARVVRASVVALRSSPFLAQARAQGGGGWRLLAFHVIPNLRPVLSAQFWILVPVFLLAEANLGALGLGIAEPVPSLGGMLAELQNYQRIGEAPWILMPAVLLVAALAGLHFSVSGYATWE